MCGGVTIWGKPDFGGSGELGGEMSTSNLIGVAINIT